MKPVAMRLMIYGTILVLLLMGCSSLPSVAQPTTATPIPTTGGSTPTPMPDGWVDVGGRTLRYSCTGQGSPTVILEAGGSDDSRAWSLVQSGGERSYRVCSYDRANLGRSDEAPKPRAYQDTARDLHTLLQNAQIGGPYILVGHSEGGMMARVFRDQYPAEVVGLVLVDAAHPDMGVRLVAGLPPAAQGEPEGIKAWRQYLTWTANSDGREPGNQEGTDHPASNEQVRAAKPLGDLPLVVISRNPDNSEWASLPALPAETNATLRQIWQDLQRELAGLSTNSTQVIANHAGHMIPTEEPELVIEAIRSLVNEARSRSGEAMPPALPEDQTGASNHTPVILRAAERTETENGNVTVYEDFSFTDAAGDATLGVIKLISSTVPMNVTDDVITASADEQKGEALVTSVWGCLKSQSRFVIEYRILDQAGNLSEPVTRSLVCPGGASSISPLLIIGIVAGLGLLLAAAWLLVGNRRASQAAEKAR